MITNYKELPLGIYLDIMALPKDGTDIDYQVRVVAILNSMTEDEVLDLPLEKYASLAAAADFLTAPVLSDDGRHVHDGTRLPATYTLGGTELVVTKSMKEMVVAQYVDFQTFGKDLTAIPALLSCLLIPKGKTYNEGYDPADVQRLVRDYLPTSDAYAIAAFFLRTFAVSIRSTLTSSLRWLKAKKRKTPLEKETIRETEALLRSVRGGAGLRTLTRSLKQPARVGAPSGTSPSPSSSTSSPTGTTK